MHFIATNAKRIAPPNWVRCLTTQPIAVSSFLFFIQALQACSMLVTYTIKSYILRSSGTKIQVGFGYVIDAVFRRTLGADGE